ncbi:MAG TPA: pitrilysin family protein, partial [Polyangiaceae bacterium]|nr:pitrilysin family protein [Polyangiaceae bacterium]
RSSPVPTSPTTVTLRNGLRATALRLPALHRVSVFCLVRVGSRYETEADSGISHLLEHMLYRGIPGHETAHEQALAFEALGGTLVATTGHDVGTLGISCPAENFEKTLGLLGRVFREPSLRGLAVEKRIVREEILEDLDEDGTLVDDYDLLRATAFSGHPLGLPVTGTIAHVDRLGEKQLRRHHDAHYVGAGTVVAVAGPVDEDVALRAVERTFGKVPRGEAIPFLPPPPPTGPSFHYVETASSQTALRVGFRGAGSADAMEPATELVLRLLDDGNSTRLYTRLCDERGLAYDVTADHETTEDAGLLHVGCGSAHSEAPTVLSEIFDVVRSLRDDGPSRSELDKAKARHRWGLDELLDSAEDVAALLAELTLRGRTNSIAERRARFDAVGRRDVRAAAERLFMRENLSVVAVGRRSPRARAALSRLVRAFE